MTITLISGSPKKGNTEFLLTALEQFLKKNGHQTNLVLLRNQKISHCRGESYCEEHDECWIKDDWQKIVPLLLKSDLIILGTPVYFNNVTGLLKNFIDRTCSLAGKLSGKKFAALCVAHYPESLKPCLEILKTYALAKELKIVGSFLTPSSDLKSPTKQKKLLQKLEKFAGKITIFKNK